MSNPHRPLRAVDTAAAPYFSCRNLHAYYGESYIVQGVSFDVKEGEIVALLGRNGAGKTSTLRSIARMAEPHLREGEIWLGGPMVVKGYWNDPEATASNFVGGYWRSGDIGSIDADMPAVA